MKTNDAIADTHSTTQERGVFACSDLLQRRVFRSCHTEKPDSDFYAHPLGIRGRRARCKACCKKWNRTQNHREASKRWNAENHQKKSAIAKAYRATPNGHAKRLANKRKDRAEISRTYAIKSLTQHTALKTNDVPAPLIAAAQAVIKLKRTLWQNRKT